jgi:hypothetical protein
VAKSKSKAKTWCSCPEPVILRNSEGEPFSPEPMCQECRHAVKRRPPGRRPGAPGIQAPSPTASWTGPGPCPRPPETETEAYRRGLALATDPTAHRQLVRSARPAPSSALASPCPDPAAARALLRKLRGL